MSTKRKYADTDGSTSESDSDHSDYTDDDHENEHESGPWALLKMEAMGKKYARILRANGEEEAKNKAYLTILPKALKGLTEYLSRSSTMDRTNKERPNTQTAYENERRLCKR